MTRQRATNPSLPQLDLVVRRSALEQRLDDGFRRIHAAERMGEPIGEWESFWVQLLREYEQVCDQLMAA